MKKRGISHIIGVILSVLITVAAVSVVYFGVNEIIRKEPEKFTSIQILTSEGHTVYDAEEGTASVQIKRGVDDAEIEKILFIFYSSGSSYTFETSDVPEKNSQRVYYFNLAIYNIGQPDYVKVVPILKKGQTSIEIKSNVQIGSILSPGNFVPFILPEQIYTDNILKNGDFEYGVQCYNLWASRYNSIYASYDFFASNDRISGDYSIEIRCIGENCIIPKDSEGNTMRAAITSRYFYTPKNKDYVFSLYAKCKNGMSAYMRVSSPTGETIKSTGDIVCKEDEWTRSEIKFNSGNNNKMRIEVYALVRTTGEWGNGNGLWARIDDVSLSYENEQVIEINSKNTGNREVKIEDNVFKVDGKPFFPLAIWGVPYDKIDEVMSWGADTTMFVSLIENTDCFNTENLVAEGNYLDKAYEKGFNVIESSAMSARLDNPAIMKKTIKRFSNHKAIIAWELADEPDHYFVPHYKITPDILKQQYEQAKQATSLPLFSVMYRTGISRQIDKQQVIEYERSYKDAMDFWMIEPAVNSAYDLKTMKQRMDLLKEADPSKYLWVDLFPYIGGDLTITSPDLVERIYWGVINGGKGIFIDGYEKIKMSPEREQMVKQAFFELGQLKDIILTGENKDSSFTVDNVNIGFIVRKYNGKIYILAVNSDNTQNINAKFSSDLINKDKRISVMFEADESGEDESEEYRQISPNEDGSFTDNFNEVERHVYVIE